MNKKYSVSAQELSRRLRQQKRPSKQQTNENY